MTSEMTGLTAHTALMSEARSLLTGALTAYRDVPRAAQWLHARLRRLDEPLRIGVVGARGVGKSTALNAVAGRGLRDAVLVEVTTPTPSQDSGGTGWDDVDASLFLTRHARPADLATLRSAQDSPVASALPVGVVLVLCRADETSAGRIDALTTARQLARRHRRDVRWRALCQNVVALSGLLAHTGRTLRESEFADLATLAAVPRAELENVLLSADRFVGADFPVPMDPATRHALLDRFGVFGLRLATTLVRTGCDTRATLSAQLVRRSGLAELRETVTRCFVDRGEVLRARSALLALELVLEREPHPTAGRLAAELERVVASAHEVRELHALGNLTSGRTALSPELTAEADRLLGGQGTEVAVRLGMAEPPSPADLHAATTNALLRWQRQAENPLLDQHDRGLVATVVRTCEGILADLSG
ncbi:hypothetical protein LX15_006165 [Streptoalloteichus tenebrarius]|uniref:G domain-containing protein n=1 Tax=Streptoalloteichus tenebrarius (strain ATCC 17920 / DSM 40477 / JCM 4838 / CBS 697.72 / NBRC 16177 / NCIMB 11028 / NRRL B-12390 / A12253. 1 / ISP 5477) TaxID=1933 RepID=A0ABT1I3R0_STRSD|nr:hypothetical protein [Streptoalloteichus tenebrarius]MCP2262428.1 hypothetical protein [Streptoalloteichus tenebrarius]BFF00786.1 GTPase [Streptoalloteichus tenebrarius]